MSAVENLAPPIEFVYDDGGRSEHFKGSTSDCAARALAIATGIPYREIYDTINFEGAREKPKKGQKPSNARTGVWPRTITTILAPLGWEWVPTMQIGSGTTVHLRADELPSGRIIVRLSKHFAAVIDGVLHDNHDSSRDGTRAVYGYWRKKDGS